MRLFSTCLLSPLLIQFSLFFWSVYNNTPTIHNRLTITTSAIEVRREVKPVSFGWSSFIPCEMPILYKPANGVVLLFLSPSFDASCTHFYFLSMPSISCTMLHLCAFVLFSLSLISYFSLYLHLSFPLLSRSLHLPSCGVSESWRAFWRFSAGGKAFWKATKGFKNKFGLFLILMSPWIFSSLLHFACPHLCKCALCFCTWIWSELSLF